MPSYTFETRLPLPDNVEELHAKIRTLAAIKDELDQELELLMGRKVEYNPGQPWHCIRCEHMWLSKLPHRPRMCPRCKVKKFDCRPTFTYAERLRKPKPAPRVDSKPQPALPHSVRTRDLPSLPPEDDIHSVVLTPPPAPSSLPIGMTLREKLALMNAVKPKEAQPPPDTISVEEATEDELVEAINNDDDAT